MGDASQVLPRADSKGITNFLFVVISVASFYVFSMELSVFYGAGCILWSCLYSMELAVFSASDAALVFLQHVNVAIYASVVIAITEISRCLSCTDTHTHTVLTAIFQVNLG